MNSRCVIFFKFYNNFFIKIKSNINKNLNILLKNNMNIELHLNFLNIYNKKRIN